MIDYNNPPEGLFVYQSETHYDQMDTQFILHHSRQVRLIERAYFAMFKKLMGTDVLDHTLYPDINVVVKKLEMQFVQALQGMQKFIITLRIIKLRSSGLTTEFEFRSEDGEILFSKGHREVCKITMQEATACFWTDVYYEKCSEMLAAGKALAKL